MVLRHLLWVGWLCSSEYDCVSESSASSDNPFLGSNHRPWNDELLEIFRSENYIDLPRVLSAMTYEMLPVRTVDPSSFTSALCNVISDPVYRKSERADSLIISLVEMWEYFSKSERKQLVDVLIQSFDAESHQNFRSQLCWFLGSEMGLDESVPIWKYFLSRKWDKIRTAEVVNGLQWFVRSHRGESIDPALLDKIRMFMGAIQ